MYNIPPLQAMKCSVGLDVEYVRRNVEYSVFLCGIFHPIICDSIVCKCNTRYFSDIPVRSTGTYRSLYVESSVPPCLIFHIRVWNIPHSYMECYPARSTKMPHMRSYGEHANPIYFCYCSSVLIHTVGNYGVQLVCMTKFTEHICQVRAQEEVW